MCDRCNNTSAHVIDNFRLDVRMLDVTMIFANDLFTAHICLGCLTDAIQERIREQGAKTPSKKPKAHIETQKKVRKHK